SCRTWRHSRRGSRGASLTVGAPPPRRLTAPPRLLLAVAHAPADTRLDEIVDVAVEDRRRIVDLVLGAQVLDHLVRVQHVGAHLIAPRGMPAGAELVERGLLLLPL